MPIRQLRARLLLGWRYYSSCTTLRCAMLEVGVRQRLPPLPQLLRLVRRGLRKGTRPRSLLQRMCRCGVLFLLIDLCPRVRYRACVSRRVHA